MPISSFIIYFNFPLENTGKFICMEAVVEPHQADHYNIHSFRNFDGIKKAATPASVILPDIKIKQQRTINNAWVHTDSEKASLLSTIVGKAIEKRNAAVIN
jgi:hypothetical protein